MVKTLSLLVTGFIGISLTGCDTRPAGPPQSELSKNCRKVRHLQGETSVCGNPEKVLVLGPAILELLLALDAQPVGFADYTTWHQGSYDNPSQQIPYLGNRVTTQPANLGSAYEPSIESIVAIQPDLIVGTGSNAPQYRILSAIAPTLLLSRNDDDTEISLRAMAHALNRLDLVEQLLTEIKQRVITTCETFAPVVAAYPQLLLLGAVQWQELYLGERNYGLCSALLEELGFQLVTPPDLNSTVSDAPIPISHETLLN
ncbi:MAG: ABC transporter substrate-binding protein [Cyanobacteria bacterium P01_F01_bin.116]